MSHEDRDQSLINLAELSLKQWAFEHDIPAPVEGQGNAGAELRIKDFLFGANDDGDSVLTGELLIKVNETNEIPQILILLKLLDVEIEEENFLKACYLLNEINQCIPFGYWQLIRNNENYVLRYRHSINCSDLNVNEELVNSMISNLFNEAVGSFSYSERINVWNYMKNVDDIEEVIDKFFNEPDSFSPTALLSGQVLY